MYKRNQPCPCGSDKKYKKCCGLAETNQIAKSDPVSARKYCEIGVLQRTHGLFEKAEFNFRRALATYPELPEAHYNLGIVLENKGLWKQAEDSYRKALSIKPDYADTLIRLGNLKKNQRYSDEAATWYLMAIEAMPDSDIAYFNLAQVRMEQGRLDEAREIFQRVLDINPDHTRAYRLVSRLIKFNTKTDKLIQKMEYLFNQNNLNDSERLHLAFALGKAYEDLAEYEKSLLYYQEGNQLKRATLNYSTSDTIALFEKIKQIFVPEILSKDFATDINDVTPFFILGMPRSGTTLVEQILASHPKVHGASELLDLQKSILQVTASEHLQEAFTVLTENQEHMFQQIGEEYLRRLKRYGSSARYIIDKLPCNFMFIGLIRLAIPSAKIIHCQRNPMDTCFSIYKNYFAGEVNYSYELTELGEYYQLYKDLMQFWHQLFPGAIYDLSYEKLIAHQEQETRRLLDYCELSFHGDCLNFHQTDRVVLTASSEQVRRPIYNDSVELWRNYESQLAPLKKVLGKTEH